jgi:hypothetical protein
VAVP